MSEDLIYRGALVLMIAVIAYLVYRWRISGKWEYRDDSPIIFDARRDESQIIEAGSILEQRKSGRERGGPLVLLIQDEPQDFSAQLNLRTLRERQGDQIDIIEK